MNRAPMNSLDVKISPRNRNPAIVANSAYMLIMIDAAVALA